MLSSNSHFRSEATGKQLVYNILVVRLYVCVYVCMCVCLFTLQNWGKMQAK